MKIGNRLLVGFMAIASLVGFVGIFSAISHNNIHANSKIITKVIELDILLDQSVIKLLALVQTENVEDYLREKTDYEETRAEFDASLKQLNNEHAKRLPALGFDVTDVRKDAGNLAKMSNRLIALHKQCLARDKVSKEKKSMEEELRARIINALVALGDEAITGDVELMHHKSMEAIYQYEDQEHGVEWLESISKVKDNSLVVFSQDVSQNLNAYELVAQDICKNIVEQKTNENQKRLTFGELKELIRRLEENQERIVNKIKAESQVLSGNTHLIVLAVIAGAFLVSIISGLTIARSISKPVANLAQTTQAIAQGDFSVRVDVATADEIGQLAASFNKMTEELQETTTSIGNLNQEIAERKKAEEELRKSESRYRSYIDLTEQLAWITNANGEIAEDIPTWRKYTGRSYEETKGFGWSTDIHPDDAERVVQVWKKAVETKSRYEAEYRIRRHDGTYHYFLARGVPTFEEDGSIREWVGVNIDITERKKAEVKLKHTAEKWITTFDSIADLVSIHDKDCKIVRVNKSFANAFNMKADEIIGKTCYELFHGKKEPPPFCPYKQTLNTGKPDRREFFEPRLGIHIEASTSPLFDENGQVIAAVHIAKDITKRKRAEAELKTAQEKLLEVARKAGMAEVAADVLHNVGNVLNSINVSTTLITGKVTNSEVANLEKVATIINEHISEIGTFLTRDPQGKHIPVYLTEVSKCLQAEQTDIIGKLQVLTDNVQHIKDIISMQQAYAKVSGVEVRASLSQLVEDAIQINSAGLQRHGTRLVREFEELPDVEIDKQRVLQILVNLVSNAKYTLSNSGKEDKLLTIRIYRRGEDRFRIELADNGVGIPKENLTKIFSHGFTTKKYGHGFGLHSGALAAKELGGSLRVHSDGLGKGATFTLELPFKPAKVVL